MHVHPHARAATVAAVALAAAVTSVTTAPRAHATASPPPATAAFPARYAGQPSVVVSPALRWPATGKVTSEFGTRSGRLHAGIDIGAQTGTPIRAAAGGHVRFAGWRGGYGRTVEIDHGDGIVTRYAHQSVLLVTRGERVPAGHTIGEVGSTGASTGPHLHFEVREDGEVRDPRRELPTRT